MPKLLSVGGYGIIKASNIARPFFEEAGIVDATQKLAIEQLIYNLCNFGLWDKMAAIYPFVGGSALSHSFNLKDCVNHNLDFFGGWVHSATGAKPNGVNAYAETNIKRSSILFNLDGNPANRHISYFIGSTPNDEGCVIGAGNGGGFAPNWILPNNGGLGNFSNGSFDNYLVPLQSNNLVLASFSLGTTTMGFAMNNSIISDMFRAVSYGQNNATYVLGATTVDGGGITRYSSSSCKFASIGLGLNKQEALVLHQITNDFQTTLNRAV